jgi:uridine kinase
VAKINFFDILRNKSPRVGNVLFIAVDGREGSGKSTLAELIAKELGAEIIHTDDFASWENPLNWWPDVNKYIFEPIREGAKTLSYPRSQWWKDRQREPVTDQSVTPIMVIEGVSASRNEFAPYISLAIFVDAPDDVRVTRGIARDIKLGLKESRDEILKDWENWEDAEKKFYAADKTFERADLIVDGTIPFEDQFEFTD